MNSNGWKTLTLDEVCLNITDGAHTSPPSVDKGYYMASVKDMGEYGFIFENCRMISETDYVKLVKNGCKPEYGDVLVGKDGANYLEDAFVFKQDTDVVLLSSIAILRPNKSKVTSEFLYYFLRNKKTRIDIKSNYGSGSAIPRMVLKDFKRVPIPVPPICEQKAIANILSSLDDKIELNNRINKNLEEMAQAIFKSWFVDFEPFQDGEFEESVLGRIPKRWRVGTLSDIAYITMGQAPSGSSYNEMKNGVIFYQGRTDFGKRYPQKRLYTTKPTRMADKGDILLSVRAPVGDINVANENCCIGRGIAALKSKNNCNSFLLYQLLSLKQFFNIYNGEGTVFGSINKDNLKNMKVLIPRERDMQEFQDIVGKFDEIFENSFNQIATLINIRDTLLPKLMSGEICVPVEGALGDGD